MNKLSKTQQEWKEKSEILLEKYLIMIVLNERNKIKKMKAITKC